ncbi:MAG: hypothetical protein N2512_05275, partial [Armatimonadetes bacterium]|nr:hypothetical protein [Armatimonadota bacterium]
CVCARRHGQTQGLKAHEGHYRVPHDMSAHDCGGAGKPAGEANLAGEQCAGFAGHPHFLPAAVMQMNKEDALVRASLKLLSGVALLFLLHPPAFCATWRSLPETFFGANCQFYQEGFYLGTLPQQAPGSRRAEFIALMRDSGIRSLRFPGGTCANLYFWDSEAATRLAAWAASQTGQGLGYWLSPSPAAFMYNYYTSVDAFLDFCRAARIEPIIQLNTVTCFHRNRLWLLAPVEKGKNLLDETTFYDAEEDVLTPAVESVRRLLRHCRTCGTPVSCWELGNEEYGMPAMVPERYAEIAAAYAQAIKAEDPRAQVLVTLGHNAILDDSDGTRTWATRMLKRLAELGISEQVDFFTLHYSGAAAVRAALDLLPQHGFQNARIAVTEFTCGWPDYWEKTPRYEHALAVADVLMQLARLPQVEKVIIHDLISQNFGVYHYNMKPFGPPDARSYDSVLGYVATPTAMTFRLARVLHGAQIAVDSPDPCRIEGRRGKAYCGLFVNRTDREREYPVVFADLGLQPQSLVVTTMRAEDLAATQVSLTEQRIPKAGPAAVVKLPAFSLAAVTGRP